MIVNPGHIVPVYDRLLDQRRFQIGGANWGIKARKDRLLPFQFWIDDSLDTSTISFTLKPIRGIVGEQSLIPYLTIHRNSDDTRTWFTLMDMGYTMGLQCGFFYVEIQHKTETWYTEVFHIVEDEYFDGLEGAEDYRKYVYDLEWWNATDLQNTLYSEGFRQKVYLEMHEGEPQNPVDRIVQEKPNGSEEVLSIQSAKRRVFQVRDVVDFWPDVFTLIPGHSNARLTKTSDSTWVQILQEVEYQRAGDSGPFFQTGELSWMEHRHDISGCGENQSVTQIALG